MGDRVSAVCTALPLHRRVTRDNVVKPVALAAYARFLPGEWAHLPKLGFPTPERAWLTGVLRDWMADHLGDGSIGRTVLGQTMAELDIESHHQLMWTLASLEEFLRVFEIERPSFED